MLFGFALHVGGSVPPPFYMKLENAAQLDVVRSMANTEPCTLYSAKNLQKYRRGQSVLSERCERSAKPLPGPSISYKNPMNPICRRFWPRVLSESLWMSHSLAITQEEVQHRCQHHVWRSSRTELSQSAPGICSSAQPDPKCEISCEISHDMSA